MINLKLISLNGENYFYLNGALYSLEGNVCYKTENQIKSAVSYGGIALPLYNGKTLVFKRKDFYIKE